MANWRERGYVPDSDEEDQEIFFRSSARQLNSLRDQADDDRDLLVDEAAADNHRPNRSEHLLVHGDGDIDDNETTATRLERVLSHGLQTVRDVLASTPPPADVLDDPETDSALSSLPSSIANSPRQLTSLSLPFEQPEPDEIPHQLPPTAFDAVTSIPRRNLRVRAPIQQHPYMLEDVIYRQLMQDRGLKPINAPGVSKHPGQAHPAEESQQTDDFPSSQLEETGDSYLSLSAPSLRFDHDSNSRDADLSHRNTSQDVEDDLPDLSQLLRDRAGASKKTLKPKEKAPLRVNIPTLADLKKGADIFDMPADEDPVTHISSRDRSFRVPPSPPRSASFDLMDRQEGESLTDNRIHRDLGTPVELPTPLISSENGYRKRPRVVLSSSESSQASEDDAASNASLSAEGDDSQGIEAIRHKIRGVLPASYLKIDMKTQERRQRRHHLQSPTALPEERGVARRTLSGVGLGRTPVSKMFSFGDSESDPENSEELEPHVTTSPTISKTLAAVQISNDNEDAVMAGSIREEPEIDPMLALSTAPGRKPRSNSLHQRRLNEGWAVSGHRSATDALSAGLVGKNARAVRDKGSRVPLKKRKKASHKSLRPEVRVLDAPGIRDTGQESRPQFLNVAARQAKRAGRKSAQPPPRKVFVLATEEDTRDVNDELQAYHRSRQHTKRSVGVTSANESRGETTNEFTSAESTLHSHQSRGLSTRLPSGPELDHLKRSTGALLSKISHKEQDTWTRKPTTGIAKPTDLAHARQPNSATATLRSLFPRHNRSGHGQLLTRPPKPRAAQVETQTIDHNSSPNSSIRQLFRKSKATKPLEHVGNFTATPDKAVQSKPERRRKKQTPRRSTLKTAKMSPQDVPDDMGSAGYDYPDGVQAERAVKSRIVPSVPPQWIDQVLFAVSTLKALPYFTTFRDNAVGDGTLRAAVEKFSDSSYDPMLPTHTRTTIKTPITRQSIPCDVYDTSASDTLSTVLDEIQHSMLYLDSLNKNDVERNNNCIDAVVSVTKYVADSAFFPDIESLSTIVERSVLWLKTLMDRLAQRSASSLGVLKGTVLQCLNRLTIYALHLHIFSKSASVHLQAESLDMCKSIINYIFETVFDPNALMRSMKQSQILCDVSLASATAVVDSTFPEAESVVITLHVCKALSISYSIKDFYQQSELALVATQPLQSIAELGMRLLAICFVLPFTQVTLDGHTLRHYQDVDDPHGSSFDLLGSYLQHFVVRVPVARAPATIGRFIEVAERLCLKMMKEWQWRAQPAIAVSFLKVYMWNSMLPFNTVPDNNDIFDNLRSITGTSPCNDNDFSSFLEIVEICIHNFYRPDPTAAEEHVTPSASKVRAFVFSLIPNHAQLCDARDQLQASQFLALKNYLALYITLYRHAPEGCGPRIQQLEREVDLTISHVLVCRLAIVAWEAIATIDIQSTARALDSLSGVNGWMNSMLQQVTARFEVHGQLDAIRLLEELLVTLATMIEKCDSEPAARALLKGDTFGTISKLLTNPEKFFNDEDVLVAGLRVMHAYAKIALTSNVSHTIIADVQLLLKNIIQQTMSNGDADGEAFLRQLMAAWFATAQVLVRTFHKHWNDFIDPHSKLSIDFLSGLKESYIASEAKECFFGHLIEEDEQYFFLECRPIVFTTWIATLLLPIHSLRFEHILTNKILHHERESLMIKDLAAVLLRHDSQRQLTIQDIADSRIIILRHIIQNIYGQRAVPEEEWLTGGLDTASLTKLLKTMTTTMKTVWMDLRQDPVAQNDYAALVHAIINEMETYPYPEFKIDSWFTDGTEFPRSEQTLDNIFKCAFGQEGGGIAKSSVVTFRLLLKRAAESRKETLLVKDLIRVFHCVDPLRIRKVQGKFEFSIDLTKQAKFVQIIFPAYIERGKDLFGSLILGPIIEILIYMTEHIHVRIDSVDPQHMAPFIVATAANICAVRKLLEATHLQHPLAASMIKYIRAAMQSVFCLLEFGVEIDESVTQLVFGNVLGVFAVVQTQLPKWTVVEDATATILPRVAPDDDEVDATVIRDNVVYDSWGDAPGRETGLVPDTLDWILHFDAEEPELAEAERELRGFAARDLGGLRGFGWQVGREEQVGLEEEMWGFVEAVKGRELVGAEGWVSEEEGEDE